ncbi:hypothetical protein [Streptomyces sp. Z26]|uniref:hypothetical protein n=1 Tax=Streptomyces sp. Z26 TaxID=2500177 RepID=UPI000EF132B8|nr:hypothetical protein [Streptomyces sp. Z26]RLL66101.1 hypothetical protein D7M15_03455 [Streptomyces sp. Z26]
MRTRSIRLATATATVATLAGAGLLTTGPAMAATAGAATAAPAFLAADELPPHPSSPWYAGGVTQGLPDPLPFCMDASVPDGDGTWHRSYHTELDTEASQVSVVTDSPQEAADLVATLEEGYANCTDEWLADNPEGTASWEDYGTVDTKDGAHVYGTNTSLPESSYDAHLFGVGRDGATVTVVSWGQMGTLDDAPVADFKGTVGTALDKL